MSSGLVGSSIHNGLKRASFHMFDRLADIPRLVRVHHHERPAVRFLRARGRAMNVFFGLAPYFYFEARPSLGERLAAQRGELYRRDSPSIRRR